MPAVNFPVRSQMRCASWTLACLMPTNGFALEVEVQNLEQCCGVAPAKPLPWSSGASWFASTVRQATSHRHVCPGLHRRSGGGRNRRWRRHPAHAAQAMAGVAFRDTLCGRHSVDGLPPVGRRVVLVGLAVCKRRLVAELRRRFWRLVGGGLLRPAAEAGTPARQCPRQGKSSSWSELIWRAGRSCRRRVSPATDARTQCSLSAEAWPRQRVRGGWSWPCG